MRTSRSLLVLTALTILSLTSMCFAASTDRITSPIVAAQTARVAAGVPMQAKAKFDKGPVDPNLQLPYITLLTVPSPAQHKALIQLLADQQNPHSASYHKWLTPEEYAAQFGLSQDDINKLTSWLKSQGFSVVRTARGHNWIVFSGTAAQVEKTFQTDIHTFNVNGEKHFSNVTRPAIPAALKGVVAGFRGMNNFWPRPYVHRSKPQYTFPYQSSNYIFLAPGDLATIYNVNALYNATPTAITGAGQAVAVFGETGIFLDDISNFRTNFGLSAISCPTGLEGILLAGCNTSNFQYVIVNGTAGTINQGGIMDEADIDIEYSGATAPGAQVIYVNADDPNGGGVWDAWYYAVDNTTAQVMSLSYGLCEEGEADNVAQGATGEFTFSSDEAELAMANAVGITFMNSSGDGGTATCDGDGYTTTAQDGYAVSYPASSVYVTAVGGTLIPEGNPDEYGDTYFGTSNGPTGGSALSYIPEQPWNDDQELGLECTLSNPPGFCAHYGITGWETAQSVVGTIAGGGGMSNCVAVDSNGVCTSGFPQPSWQAGLDFSAINPGGIGMVNSTLTRAVPDVSLLASPNRPGYIFCTQSFAGSSAKGSTCDSPTTGVTDMLPNCFTGAGPCSLAGGTSFASPIFAGMVTLMNQDVVVNGGTAGLGNINSTLYQLAATPGNFNPVTTGAGGSCTPDDPNCGTYSNGIWCSAGTPSSGVTGDPWPTAMQCPSSGNALLSFNSFNFDATTNYNLAVGIGSPNANTLAAAMVADVLATQATTVAVSCSTGCGSAGVTASAGLPAVYTLSVAPSIGTTFGATITFSCSFNPTDPTLTNSVCAFSPSSIASGTSGAQTVTLTITTAGPNVGSNPRTRKRADNRMPILPFTLPIAGVVLAGFAGRKWSKYSVVAGLCLALLMAGLLVACSSSSNSGTTTTTPTVSNVTANPTSLYPNYAGSGGSPAWPTATSTISVTTNDAQGVTLTAGLGTIGAVTCSSGTCSATYTAPAIVAGLPASDTITATSVTSTGVSAQGSITLTPATVPGTYHVTVSPSAGTGAALTMIVQ